MPYKTKVHKVDLPGRKDEAGNRRINSTIEQRRADKIRSSGPWKRISLRFRKTYPLCVDPFQNHPERVVAVKDVHHVVGVAEAPERWNIWNNLRPLCRACHNKIESMERRGIDTRKYFDTNKPKREHGTSNRG